MVSRSDSSPDRVSISLLQSEDLRIKAGSGASKLPGFGSDMMATAAISSAISLPQSNSPILHEMQTLPSGNSTLETSAHPDRDPCVQGTIANVPIQGLHEEHVQLSDKTDVTTTIDATSYLQQMEKQLSHQEAQEAQSLADGASILQYYDEAGDGSGLFANNVTNQQLAAAVAASYPSMYSVGSNSVTTNSYTYDLGNLTSSTNVTTSAPSSLSAALSVAAAAAAATSQSPPSNPTGQLITYGGSTFLIQPSTNGGNPLITTIDTNTGNNLDATGGSNGTGGGTATMIRSGSPHHGQSTLVHTGQGNGVLQQGQQGTQNISQHFATQMALVAAATRNSLEGQDGNNSSMKNTNLSYATRVAPATIQWLLSNYETAEGVSLPRSTLYSHYQKHCEETDQEPVNAASFGKLIRSVFLGLRTRRIGTRGNSKYHYYGIRVKPTSSLNHLEDVQQQQQQVAQPIIKKKQNQNATSSKNNQAISIKHEHSSSSDGITAHSEGTSFHQSSKQSNKTNNESIESSDNALAKHFGSNYPEIEGFPVLLIPEEHLSLDLEPSMIDEFSYLYKQHCQEIFDAVSSLKFERVEKIWLDFWSESNSVSSPRPMSSLDDSEEADNSNASNCFSDDLKFSKEIIMRSKIVELAQIEEVKNFIKEADVVFYQKLIDFLMPDVLKSVPNALIQSIRNFAKCIEDWMHKAIEKLPEDFQNIKMTSVRVLSQILRRYTSLNHLAQASRAVITNSSLIQQMISDLNRVDFSSLQDQAYWICKCDTSLVEIFNKEFQSTLQSESSIDEWSNWMESVVERAFKEEKTDSSEDIGRKGRCFLLHWSFYCSMIIRDLTLRSAASFGSFHLIRLLLDEYMFFLVEKRVSKAFGKNTVAILALEMMSRRASLKWQGNDCNDRSCSDEPNEEGSSKKKLKLSPSSSKEIS